MTDFGVVLRPLERADAEVLAAWAGDEKFCQHAGWTLRSIEALRRFWVNQVESPPAGLIRLAASSEENGLLGYVDLDGNGQRERELGFLIGPSKHWGQGFARRIAEAGLTYGFDQLLLESIWAEAVVANVASVRILRSLGMQETGRGCAETFLQTDSYYQQFRLTRDEWNASRRER